jgi:hypothetical protein
MRTFATVSAVSAALFVIVGACTPQNQQQQQPGQYPPGYVPQAGQPGYTGQPAYNGQPGYPAQPGYPQQQPGYPQQQPQPAYTAQPAPQPGAYPTAAPTGAPTGAPTAPAAGGAMSTPGPLALPCTNDGPCGLHHCNTQYQKCAFPCTNAETDCISPNACILGVCVPKAPGT